MFFARIDEANARIAEIEGAMRFWYLAGTAMLLFSSVLASILMDKSLRRIENQITGTKGGRRGSRGSSAKEQTGKE
jgi:CRISPR/Cas system CMR-associated protein Cmr1 (group 7 of RAMP superfamily)